MRIVEENKGMSRFGLLMPLWEENDVSTLFTRVQYNLGIRDQAI